MVTKKQHYYPRTLIKHFANEDDKLYSYIAMANKIQYVNYQNVCAENYTYEGSSGVDNILENKLSLLEDKLAPIIEKILTKIRIKNNEICFNITKSEVNFLYQYMWLQFIRTDAGRINFIRNLNNIKYTGRKYPIKLEEIKECKKREILEFNDRFKQEGVLEAFLKFFKKPDFMNFHIVVGENFITSDNPVVLLDSGGQMYMPISKNICVAFQSKEFNCSEKVVIPITPKKNRYINECQIETANYYVLSKDKFDIYTNYYIYKRFHKMNWEVESTHFNQNFN